MTCEHSGTHSGAMHYMRDDAQLRLVLVCDHCGEECAELGRIDYRPTWAAPTAAGVEHGRAA